MELPKAISLFFEQTPYKNWCFYNCLEFLESKCSRLRSINQQHIQDEYKNQIHSMMNHQSVSKSAKNKATKLYKDIEDI
jgi:hypothetical protein